MAFLTLIPSRIPLDAFRGWNVTKRAAGPGNLNFENIFYFPVKICYTIPQWSLILLD